MLAHRRSPARIVRVHGVGDSPIEIAVRLVPQARALVERAHELGSRPPQLGTQRVAEQAMPPVALVSGIERTQQRRGPLQPRQDAPRPGALENRVADRARQLVEHRRPDGKLGQLARQRREHLVAEILGETVIIASEAVERSAQVDLFPERQGREVQAGRPPLGSRHERLQRGEVELEAGLPQEDRRFGRHHREVLDANLDERAARAQAPERHRGLGAGPNGDH